MSITYNTLNVDQRYSDKLEANLYYASVLVPGATCDDNYLAGPAGASYVYKLSTQIVEPGTPGQDFTDTDAGDDLMKITLNNNFQRSRKVYGVQVASITPELKDEALAAAQREVQSSWAASGVACLVGEASVSADTAVPTVDTAKAMVVDVRTEIIRNGGVPDVVLCAPSFYAMVLKAAGDEFQSVDNENMAATGNVGVYLGMTWVEASCMAKGSGKYYDYTDTLKTVDYSKVDFVVYNHNALSAVTNFETARMVGSEDFVGAKAQVELNAGYRVRDPQQAVVHKHA